MSHPSDLTQICDQNSLVQKPIFENVKVDIMKAQKSDVSIGKMHQAKLPSQILSSKQIKLKKNKLMHLKIWSSKSDQEMQRINEVFKEFRRKFGRNAQYQDEFFTLLSRANLDLELVEQLIQFEDKFLKKYIQDRSSDNKYD